MPVSLHAGLLACRSPCMPVSLHAGLLACRSPFLPVSLHARCQRRQPGALHGALGEQARAHTGLSGAPSSAAPAPHSTTDGRTIDEPRAASKALASTPFGPLAAAPLGTAGAEQVCRGKVPA